MTTPTKRVSPAPAAQPAFKAVNTSMEEVLVASRQAAARPASASPAKAVAEISGNPFYKVMFDPAMSLDEKRQAMAQSLVYDKSLSEEQNAQRLDAFVQFSEWLQSKRKELAIEMLKLNDAEAFAQLKGVIDELGQGILDFNKKIQPFLAILDSLYKMQLNGVKTSDMLAEIVNDREEIERLNKELDGHTEAMDTSDTRIRAYNDRIAELKTETSWWSFGTKIKPDAQADINKLELRVTEERGRIEELSGKVEATQTAINAPRVTQFQGLEDVKDNLRTLLDITSDTHRERQKQLNQTAADFVSTSEQRVASVLKNIEAMNGRIDAAGKNSSKVLGLYAVMNDAIGTAMVDNHGVLDTLKAPEGEEGLIPKMKREETREGSLRHIKTLTGIKEDTVKMYDGLSREKAELSSMLDSNDQQISATRYLHGSGIANMGMQLNAMITALGSAANGQSTKVAQELVDEMGSSAIMIRGKDSLRAAIDFQGTNETLERTIQLAAQSAELMRNASAITGDALEKQQVLLQRVKQGADGIQEAITESLQVYADKTAPEVSNDNVVSGGPRRTDDLAGFNLK
jgi:hypothetical protein